MVLLIEYVLIKEAFICEHLFAQRTLCDLLRFELFNFLSFKKSINILEGWFWLGASFLWRGHFSEIGGPQSEPN